MASGTNAAELDFDSVQRGNPEIERRAQEVINHCWAQGDKNPSWPSTTWVLAACPMPSRADQRCGPWRALRPARRQLEESGLAPKEIWSNESQERYVMAIAPESLAEFTAFCERERCPFAVIGTATEERQLVLEDTAVPRRPEVPRGHAHERAAGQAPKMHRDVATVQRELPPMDLTGVPLEKAVIDVLAHPTVASKRFLITIGDRAVGGLTHRDQMVGPGRCPWPTWP
ncbi:Phosphoribosylformylglycinamidine synthase [Manis javanica]|nr:Phosphoribosylformylglycinamidine synthase [Manis javanica]